MVVMDYVDGKSIWQLQVEGTPIPAVVLEKVEEAVDLLHKNDIVLRDPNILYVADEDCVMLVDFDWSVKDEEGRYPAVLNPNNAWSEKVLPYGIMCKSHDIWQLNRLRNYEFAA
jgi:RIO-like serine/threonine protein kinase